MDVDPSAQAAFRAALRQRTRPPKDDDDWQPRPRATQTRRTPGPEPLKNPSPRTLNTRNARAAARARGLPDGDPRHGKKSGYVYYGCRCAPCTAANSDHCGLGSANHAQGEPE